MEIVFFLECSYIILLHIITIFNRKIFITEKQYKCIFFLLAIALAGLGFIADPPYGWDLYRHFVWMDEIRWSNLSLGQFLFQKRFLIGGSSYAGLYTFNILRYLLTKVSLSNSLLPAICILIDYSIWGYITIDWSKSNSYNGRISIDVLLLTSALFPYIHALSGMRNILSVSLMGLGIYLYLYKKKNIFIFILLALLSVTVHPVTLIAIPFVCIVKMFKGLKGVVLVFIISLSLQTIANFLVQSGIPYFKLIGTAYNNFTMDGQYRGGRFCLYGALILVLVFIVSYFINTSGESSLVKEIKLNSPKARLYAFLVMYMVYIMGNLGNYDLVVRPAYLLGLFSAPLVTLYKEYDGKQRETYVFLTVLRCIVLLISLYVSYIYLTMTVDAFKGWM